MSNRSDYQGHDNSLWHMLPRGAQDAWRRWVKRAESLGQPQTTSSAWAAGCWWAITYLLQEARANAKDPSALTQPPDAASNTVPPGTPYASRSTTAGEAPGRVEDGPPGVRHTGEGSRTG